MEGKGPLNVIKEQKQTLRILTQVLQKPNKELLFLYYSNNYNIVTRINNKGVNFYFECNK